MTTKIEEEIQAMKQMTESQRRGMSTKIAMNLVASLAEILHEKKLARKLRLLKQIQSELEEKQEIITPYLLYCLKGWSRDVTVALMKHFGKEDITINPDIKIKCPKCGTDFID